MGTSEATANIPPGKQSDPHIYVVSPESNFVLPSMDSPLASKFNDVITNVEILTVAIPFPLMVWPRY